jgi:hypothetical protein
MIPLGVLNVILPLAYRKTEGIFRVIAEKQNQSSLHQKSSHVVLRHTMKLLFCYSFLSIMENTQSKI